MRIREFRFSTVDAFKDTNWYSAIFLSAQFSSSDALAVTIEDVDFRFTARTTAQRDVLFMLLREISRMEEENEDNQ